MTEVKTITITGDENEGVIEILPDRVRYEFDSLSEAIEALPNLEELNQE